MNVHDWNDIKRKKLSDEKIAEIREQAAQDVLEMHLKTLREQLGITQSELAELMDTQQPQLSKMESQTDFLMSTLRRYVEALGGDLEVTAVFEGTRIRLSGV
ncbi:MAG: helix-turn-helix domain-containing protein [Myxococcota bacterium]